MPPDLFRRNLIGLLVVLGCGGALYLTEVGPAASTYHNSAVPRYSAGAGGSVAVGGVNWRIRSSDELAAIPGVLSKPLPPGTVARVVTIDRAGNGADQPCIGVITDGSSRWKAESIGAMAVLPPAGTSTNCATPGPVQFTFVVPRDAGVTAVDVVQFDNQIIVRLAL